MVKVLIVKALYLSKNRRNITKIAGYFLNMPLGSLCSYFCFEAKEHIMKSVVIEKGVDVLIELTIC